MPRPTDYSPEVVTSICQRIAEGDSLRSICAADDMPNKATVLRWLKVQPEFHEAYGIARQLQTELMAEEILEIADDVSQDTIAAEQGPRPNAEWIARSKLRVDARKWLMSKLAPKKYGDRISAEHTGRDGGPIEHKHMTDLELARRIAFILTRADKAKREGK
jgi:hypothetical protein